MEKSAVLIDPYGLRITITDSLCSLEKGLKLYNDYRAVIERPAFIIDMSASSLFVRYYFRSVGWGTKLLIKVEKVSGEWRAYSCDKNPSDRFLHNLARQGSLLSAGSGDQDL
jgi:hypothetical protein